MIDVENDVFNAVASALRTAYEGIFVTGEEVPADAAFPAVSIVEADNRVATRYRTTNIENAVYTMYEVNVYSNKAAGKKTEAKAIASTLDTKFAELGFTRTMRNQVPNFNDRRIYRIVCRYEGTIIPNDDGKFYVYSK